MKESDRVREVAMAWRLAWDADEDGYGAPQLCEGCSMPATNSDSEGLPLCDTCLGECQADHHKQLIGAVQAYLAELDAPGPDQVTRHIDRLRDLVRTEP